MRGRDEINNGLAAGAPLSLAPRVSRAPNFPLSLPLSSACHAGYKGWSRNEIKSCFSMSLTSSSTTRDRNKYGGIWRRSINFFKGYSLCYCGAISRRVLLFVCIKNHISVTRGWGWRQRKREFWTVVISLCANHFDMAKFQALLSRSRQPC